MEKLFTKTKKETEETTAQSQLTKREPEKEAAPAPKRTRKVRKRLKPEERLKSSQFRLLNQFLYENPSEAAVDLFSKRKEDFEVYHQGFANQI